MSEPFIPLDLSRASLPRVIDTGSSLKVAPKPDLMPAFIPLSEITAAHAHAHAQEAEAARRVPEPTITLQRDGDRVTGIRVACSCGQVIELACAY